MRGFCLALIVLALLRATPVQAQDEASDESQDWIGAAQLATVTDSFTVRPGMVRVQLSRAPVLDIVWLQIDGNDWPDLASLRLTRGTGLLVLPVAFAEQSRIVVRYRYDPALLTSYLALRELLPAHADTSSVFLQPAGPAPPDAASELARDGPGQLRIDGSKTISVQGGTNREATVDQGLNLSISGALTEGIGVRAEISDDNLPITPEGNTEALRDLDQVRIELFGRHGRAIVGDFRVDKPLGVFVPYERKLQGFSLLGRHDKGYASAFGGAPRGSRVQTEFFGREAAQGPYEIVDGLRLDQSVIVAGSERVFVDGMLVRRGADRDYTIDYIRGTVSFTSRLPITANSRIAVDFELSDSAYRRNVFSAGADSVRLGPVRLGAVFLRDGEDRNRPRDQALSSEEIALLEAAGDDPSLAISQGVTAVAPGEGAYVEMFTPGGQRYFAPADTSGGDFDVNFRFVGPAAGEYTLEGATETGILNFVFQGPALGDYTVGRQLALPSVTDVARLSARWGGDDQMPHLGAEIDITDHDANRFSSIDDGNNAGSAWRLSVRSPSLFGEPDQGTGLRVQGRAERIEDRFHELGRIRRPFFYEAFNLQNDARERDEEYYDFATVAEFARRRADFGWQRLEREGQFLGDRLSSTGHGTVVGPLNWTHRWARALNRRTGQADGKRLNRHFGLNWSQFRLVPFANYSSEQFEDFQASRATGFRRETLTSGVTWTGHGELALSREEADSLLADASGWANARQTWTARARANASPGRVTLDADLTWRQSELPSGEDETTRLARVRAGWRDPDRGLVLDTGYRISNDNSRVLSRQIVFVGIGKGQYDIEGNPVGPGRGDYELLYTPSDSTVTATEVEFDTQVDWRPRFTLAGGFSNLLVASVREQSRSDEIGKLLLLDPSVLRQEESTVFGEGRLRNDLTLLRSYRRLDLRYSYEIQETLDQRFTEGAERSDRSLHEARLEGQFSARWSGWVQGGREQRSRESAATLNPLLQGFRVLDHSAATALRWRQGTRARMELALRYTLRDEQEEDFQQDIWSIEPSANLNALGARWSAVARLARITEQAGPDPVRPYFFEAPGTARSAGLQAQWGASGLLSFNLRYQITDEPGRELRQDMGVETRARF
ncbi:hypothetical protein DRQ53_02050 [bacterium]|nr:MAG: hypothetical protein DRQ53_02050 [bacterium]